MTFPLLPPAPRMTPELCGRNGGGKGVAQRRSLPANKTLQRLPSPSPHLRPAQMWRVPKRRRSPSQFPLSTTSKPQAKARPGTKTPAEPPQPHLHLASHWIGGPSLFLRPQTQLLAGSPTAVARTVPADIMRCRSPPPTSPSPPSREHQPPATAAQRRRTTLRCPHLTALRASRVLHHGHPRDPPR